MTISRPLPCTRPSANGVPGGINGNPITWTYDDLYRLTGQAKAGQVCTYTLDGVGNLLTMWEGGNFPKTFTFNAADRLVTMMEGASLTTYAWTGYGALESEVTGNATTAYSYNGQDQLVLVTPPSGFPSTYAFDGDGLRRTAQEGNVPPTTMVWDGSDYLLLSEPGANRVVLTLDSEILACGNKDLLTDPLGSLVKEISAGASMGSLVEMYPYGQLVSGTGSPTTPYVYVAAYGYYNDSLERDYVRARELYKKLGRWMQTDPLWPDERANRYGEASPTVALDPYGLEPQKQKHHFPPLLPDLPSPGDDCTAWDPWCHNPFTWPFGLLACYLCLKPIYDDAWKVTNKLPGLTEGERNAMRHCYASCVACEKCGCACAQQADYREWRQWFTGTGGTKGDAACDLVNNGMGRVIGCGGSNLSVTPCLKSCLYLLKKGLLCIEEPPVKK